MRINVMICMLMLMAFTHCSKYEFDSYSIFVVYERSQAFDNSHNGHNDNLYIAIGYLPGKNTEYSFVLNGTDNLMSEFEIKKDINGFDLIFNLNDDLTRFGDAREAYIELNKVF